MKQEHDRIAGMSFALAHSIARTLVLDGIAPQRR
jgi:hypothetical protein